MTFTWPSNYLRCCSEVAVHLTWCAGEIWQFMLNCFNTRPLALIVLPGLGSGKTQGNRKTKNPILPFPVSPGWIIIQNVMVRWDTDYWPFLLLQIMQNKNSTWDRFEMLKWCDVMQHDVTNEDTDYRRLILYTILTNGHRTHILGLICYVLAVYIAF